MIMKNNAKCNLTVLIIVVSALCGLHGCGSGKEADQPAAVVETVEVETTNPQMPIPETNDTQAAGTQVNNTQPAEAQSGEDFDVIEPSAADDKWYMTENVYTDENGRRLEVGVDDYGMLEFSIDGLSMYYATADNFQQENNWKIYTCDDGTVIIYYPGTPAHLEISDGDYAGVYEADDVK